MLSHDPSVFDKLRVQRDRQKGLAPVNTLEVNGPFGLATVIADKLPKTTSQTARELYRVLVEVSIRVEQARGHAPTVTEAVIHLPVELLANAVGVSRVTVWRHLPALRELGLVDYRTHKASWRYRDHVETRNSGTVFRVRLSPLRGVRARVSADDLRHRWRGKEMRGAASRRALKLIRATEDKVTKVLSLVSWSLSPGDINPVDLLGFKLAQSSLETLLDLTGAHRQERAQSIDTAALALSQAMRDASSLNWYRKLLWSVLRRYDATGRDETRVIYLTAQRCAVDASEGFARRAGALLVSRLKAHGWLEEVMAV